MKVPPGTLRFSLSGPVLGTVLAFLTWAGAPEAVVKAAAPPKAGLADDLPDAEGNAGAEPDQLLKRAERAREIA